ncbi:MAG TPA: hypothetical protein VHR37_06110, partial [Solirubrobacterales bacterium]|nr:hypothetical protein [Solirubrobacterales bacterium]
MPRFRIPLVLAIAVVVASLVVAGALGANVKRIDSTVTLAKKNPFHGHVSSPNSGCEQARTVKVFKKRNGPDGLYDSTTTANDGKWSIPATPTGNFYAKVIRRKEGAAGTIFVCKPDVSPTRH